MSGEGTSDNGFLSVLIPGVKCFVELLETRGILGRHMTHHVVTVTARQRWPKFVGRHVGGVEQCRNPLKLDQVLLNPLAEDVILDVKVLYA